MALPITSPSMRATLFALPSYLRVRYYQQTRAFSASPPSQVSLVDAVVAGPNALLDGIHGVGIPWGAAIPISAVFVRTVLVHIISTRPARRRAQIQSQLLPLASAHARLEQLQYAASAGKSRTGLQSTATLEASKTSRSLTRLSPLRFFWIRYKTIRKLSKEFGAGGFRPWGLLNFGMLIAFTETIRMKCGAREGLLPMLLKPFTWVGQKVAPAYFPPPPIEPPAVEVAVQDPAEILAEKIWAIREGQTTEDAVTAPSVSSESPSLLSNREPGLDIVPPEPHPTGIPRAMNSYYDPTMQTEGLPWIANLTLPDPTYILPVTLFFGMIANTLLRRRVLNATKDANRSFFSNLTVMQRLGVVVATLIGFAALKMPAAVLLYFAPSIIAGWLHGRWLDWKYPMAPPVIPARRRGGLPVRLMR